jgi:hypothetical protein
LNIETRLIKPSSEERVAGKPIRPSLEGKFGEPLSQFKGLRFRGLPAPLQAIAMALRLG